MCQKRRNSAMFVLLGFLISLLIITTPQAANADPVTPAWTPVKALSIPQFITNPAGGLTVGCKHNNDFDGNDLTTYDSSGTITQQIDRTQQIDGVNNCIDRPAIDSNGDVYGVPINASSPYAAGPNLLAYSGNTLKWKYPAACSTKAQYTVGVDGKIYTLLTQSNGLRLVGLTPEPATGQTVPTEVLNVPITDSDCGSSITAYKYGLIVRQSANGDSYKYFDYKGKYLGASPTTTFAPVGGGGGNPKFNDNGTMFSYVLTSGNGSKVVASSPQTGQEVWSYPLVPGSYMGNFYPTSDGGVVLAIDEPAMVSPGIPESPARTLFKLVTISPAGQYSRSTEVGAYSGTSYGSNWGRVAVDSNGKAAVLKSTWAQNAQNVWQPSVHMNLIDTTNGNMSTTYTLANTALEVEENNVIQIANDQVVFMGFCGINCGTSWGKHLYSVPLSGIDLDYPKSSILAGLPTDGTYVALGDSYSSGEGTFNYTIESGTCHRSPDSYPYYIASEFNLSAPRFGACSGAQTDDFYKANPTKVVEPAQFSHLSPDTQKVTLTIGGNDMDFGGAMKNCAEYPGKDGIGWGCASDTAFTGTINAKLSTLAGSGSAQTNGRTVHSLSSVFQEIDSYSPDAAVYVAGYPRLFGSNIADYTSNSNAPGGASCAMPIGATISYDDAQWLNGRADALNAVISQAVTTAQNGGMDITYVPPAFSGHGLCDNDTPWIHGIVFDDALPTPGYLKESFHPDITGYLDGYGLAYAVLMS